MHAARRHPRPTWLRFDPVMRATRVTDVNCGNSCQLRNQLTSLVTRAGPVGEIPPTGGPGNAHIVSPTVAFVTVSYGADETAADCCAGAWTPSPPDILEHVIVVDRADLPLFRELPVGAAAPRLRPKTCSRGVCGASTRAASGCARMCSCTWESPSEGGSLRATRQVGRLPRGCGRRNGPRPTRMSRSCDRSTAESLVDARGPPPPVLARQARSKTVWPITSAGTAPPSNSSDSTPARSQLPRLRREPRPVAARERRRHCSTSSTAASAARGCARSRAPGTSRSTSSTGDSCRRSSARPARSSPPASSLCRDYWEPRAVERGADRGPSRGHVRGSGRAQHHSQGRDETRVICIGAREALGDGPSVLGKLGTPAPAVTPYGRPQRALPMVDDTPAALNDLALGGATQVRPDSPPPRPAPGEPGLHDPSHHRYGPREQEHLLTQPSARRAQERNRQMHRQRHHNDATDPELLSGRTLRSVRYFLLPTSVGAAYTTWGGEFLG